MKKQITTIVFILLSTFSFGQHKEIENFIRQVYQQIVPPTFGYYNLLDSSFVINLDKYSLNPGELKKIQDNNPNFPYDNFVSKCKNSVLINWGDYNLEKARIYSHTNIPKFSYQTHIRIVPYDISQKELDSLEKIKKYNEIIVPLKEFWRDKRKNKEIKKVWKKYSDSKSPEDKIYFRFSTPIFSDDGFYAMISINLPYGGATHIFKKINDKWTEIFIFKRWVS